MQVVFLNPRVQPHHPIYHHIVPAPLIIKGFLVLSIHQHWGGPVCVWGVVISQCWVYQSVLGGMEGCKHVYCFPNAHACTTHKYAQCTVHALHHTHHLTLHPPHTHTHTITPPHTQHLLARLYQHKVLASTSRWKLPTCICFRTQVHIRYASTVVSLFCTVYPWACIAKVPWLWWWW